MNKKNRVDVVDVVSELNALSSAFSSPKSLNSVEHWAEELACKSSSIEYVWDEDNLAATIQCGGIDVLICADEVRTQIEITFSWKQLGNEYYKDVRKWLPKAKDKIESFLQKSGWTVSELTIGDYRIEGNASVSLSALQHNFSKYCDGLQKSIESLQFK